jgi:hypothetical protein
VPSEQSQNSCKPAVKITDSQPHTVMLGIATFAGSSLLRPSNRRNGAQSKVSGRPPMLRTNSPFRLAPLAITIAYIPPPPLDSFHTSHKLPSSPSAAFPCSSLNPPAFTRPSPEAHWMMSEPKHDIEAWALRSTRQSESGLNPLASSGRRALFLLSRPTCFFRRMRFRQTIDVSCSAGLELSMVRVPNHVHPIPRNVVYLAPFLLVDNESY